MTRVGTPRLRARKRMSVCVVALQRTYSVRPLWIARQAIRTQTDRLQRAAQRPQILHLQGYHRFAFQPYHDLQVSRVSHRKVPEAEVSE